MLNSVRIFTLSILFLFGVGLHAQIGGNQIYQNSTIRDDRTPVRIPVMYSTDTTLVIPAKVLLNKAAESYIITVGVNSISTTVKEANNKTNKKIATIIPKLRKLGINKNDIYVDFISETKMYDQDISDKKIEEYLEGFNIRKNLVIKTKEIQHIDSIIEYCADEEVYDIIKVDYTTADLEEIKEFLFREAFELVKKKKKNFVDHSTVKPTNAYRIASQTLEVYYPKNLYKQYNEAFETSLAENRYGSSYIKKEVRKERSFYYDGMETEVGVDKIIDETAPRVGIQYILEVNVVYQLEN